MPHYNLAFLGFGNVGKALAQLLDEKKEELRQSFNLTFSITAIGTSKHGSAINPDGINPVKAVNVANGFDSDNISQFSKLAPLVDSNDFIKRCGADVLFENTPVNYKNGQPAVSHINLALAHGMHVVTANKGPVVHAYRELTEFAKSKGLKFYFESTVMDGAPIFSLFRETLPAAQLRSFRGILNSTTNMILTRMELGDSFDDAVIYCQKIGIAETDPSGDIDGWDAAVKIAALVTVTMGIPLKPQEVIRVGIREIRSKEVADALNQGKRWKLVCSARVENGGIHAEVKPELIDRSSPLFSAEGTTSVMQFETDVLGMLSITEENPGPRTTAYGCLADFINIVRSNK